ncbi:MAG: hypothetical protein ACQ9IQ_12825 [Nitrospirales bacterium]
MKKLVPVIIVLILILSAAGYSQAPKSGNVNIEIDLQNPAHLISHFITGVGLSFAHDTDEFIEKLNAANKFREIGIGSLRYPGGHKTSSYHWEEPWYPVYLDKYSPELPARLEKMGLTEAQLPEANAGYMDLDEFLNIANQSGAEPLVGINIKSGQLYDREAEQTAETVRMFEHIKKQEQRVIWYYIDNEVGHKPHQKPMTVPEYAGYINRLVPELRKIQPDAKFIVNLMGAPYSSKNIELMRLAGKNYNAVDTHHYWNWGKASWSSYLSQRPLEKEGTTLDALADKFRVERGKLGMEHIELMSLEWSAGPVAEGETLSAYQCALIESEMMGQFIKGDYLASTMWPFHWKAGGRVYPGRVFIDQSDEATHPIKDVFTLYSRARGSSYVPTKSESTDIVAHAAISEEGEVFVYLLNKSPERHPVTLKMDRELTGTGTRHTLYGSDLGQDSIPAIRKSAISIERGIASSALPPWSFSLVEIKASRPSE